MLQNCKEKANKLSTSNRKLVLEELGMLKQEK